MRAAAIILAAAIIAGCSGEKGDTGGMIEIAEFSVRDLEGVISRSGVSLDRIITSDGNGSISIEVEKPGTYRLYETGDIDLEKSRLIYRARVRTEDAAGKVYLEMRCTFPGRGEFFSRGLDSHLAGTTGWSSVETLFLLKEGENPDNVKLNIVAEGSGRVWVDDIKLIAGPL